MERNNICGDSEEEEEAGTVKHCVERDIYRTRSRDSLTSKRRQSYKEKCGVKMGTSVSWL